MKEFLLFFFLVSLSIDAQDFSQEALSEMNDKELLVLFNDIIADTVKAEKVIHFYLNRAREERDTFKIVKAYRGLITISKPSKKLNFLDSIIDLTKGLNNKSYPAVGYILKGLEYYSMGNLKLATKNYFEAYQLALKNDNITQQIFIADKLIGLKSFWGDRSEALELQKKRHKLVSKDEYIKEVKESARVREGNFENLYDESVLISIQNFIICYINLKELDSASIYLEKGFKKVSNFKGYNKSYFHDWFTLASAEIDSRLGKHDKAIATSNQLLKSIDIESNLEIVLDIYFFKGFSLIKSGEYEKGIEYLNKADSLFTEKQISLLPYHRNLFEELLAYHNSKDDIKMKIKYLNKLLVVDSIFKRNYQFFEPNLIKNYETPLLLKEKENLITSLKQKNEKYSATTWWLIVFLGVSLVALLYYFTRQLLYKKRFENLMLQQEVPKLENIDVALLKNEVSSEITNDILSHLNHFERKKEFLFQEISLQKLAKSFGTNHTYLSKVINSDKNKNFTVYINDLRIEYIFEELKLNEKLRKYTIKAIALECGFASAESFSKSFYKKYGLYPSYYIRELEKSNI